MKNNKGFTLIELLAIVVILALIILIAAPNMTKQIKKKDDTDQTILDEKIYNAARMYAAKYYAEEIVNGTRDIEFTLSNLENDGLLDLKGKCRDNNILNGVIEYKISDKKFDFSAIAPSCVSKQYLD